METAEAVLLQAWGLAEELAADDSSPELEAMLPTLVEAGYAEATDDAWRFTEEGVRRANELRALLRESPWPFDGSRFPPDLGVVVMRTVVEGEMPALQVIHAPEDWWGIADGVNSPNDGASIGVHFGHVLDIDPSLHELATMPPGFKADREDAQSPWVISEFSYGSD